MTMKPRRTFSPKFKAEVVLKVLGQEESSAEICRRNNIAAEQVSTWKKEFITHADRVFASDRATDQSASRIAELERQALPGRTLNNGERGSKKNCSFDALEATAQRELLMELAP